MSLRLMPSAFGQSLRAGRHFVAQQQPQQKSIVRFGHTVRLIAVQDLPHGKAYKGDVLTVKAGYARNYLIPKKMALYATPQNFERLGMVDPDVETEAQRTARLQQQLSMSAGEEKYLKDADLLKKYLKNKVVGESMQNLMACCSSRWNACYLETDPYISPTRLFSLLCSSNYGETSIPTALMPCIQVL
jgi:Ribosomal protein L9, N-terminal domain